MLMHMLCKEKTGISGVHTLGNARRSLRFEQRLVLRQWLLGLFGVGSFERLTANLKAPEYEGFDENNITRFHRNLKLLFDFDWPGLPPRTAPGLRPGHRAPLAADHGAEESRGAVPLSGVFPVPGVALR